MRACVCIMFRRIYQTHTRSYEIWLISSHNGDPLHIEVRNLKFNVKKIIEYFVLFWVDICANFSIKISFNYRRGKIDTPSERTNNFLSNIISFECLT